MKEYILSRTDIDEKTFNKNKSKDWFFTTDEMLQYGLVDKIVDDLDEIL